MKVYKIENDSLSCEIMDYGLRMINLIDKRDNSNLIISYKNILDYRDDESLVGALLVGRSCGRTFPANINLGTNEFKLSSENDISLHGAESNWAYQNFKCVSKEENQITFSLNQPSVAGYPGNLKIRVKIVLKRNKIEICSYIKTDATTFLNPSGHVYFKRNENGLMCTSEFTGYYPINDNYISSTSLNKYQYNNINLDDIANKIGFNRKVLLNNCFILKSPQIDHFVGDKKVRLSSNVNSVVIYSGEYLSEVKNRLNTSIGACYEYQYQLNAIKSKAEKSNVIIGPDKELSYNYSFEII